MARLFRGRHSKLRLVPSTLSKEDFQRVYDLMDTHPMDSDCGILCGSLCCTEYEPGVGMYLLPGEDRSRRKPTGKDRSPFRYIDMSPGSAPRTTSLEARVSCSSSVCVANSDQGSPYPQRCLAAIKGVR